LDEPTSSLDLSVQAQVLNLLQFLKAKYEFTAILVSHDLAVVQHLSDRVAVVYLGQIIEQGPAPNVFTEPSHPYTQALIAASLSGDPDDPRPPPPSGEIPSLAAPPLGCRFHTRCPFVMERCFREPPPPYIAGPRHLAACHLLDKGPADQA
jgi:oligopeptide/dipeptide ABC transporter ATP-binding protein